MSLAARGRAVTEGVVRIAALIRLGSPCVPWDRMQNWGWGAQRCMLAATPTVAWRIGSIPQTSLPLAPGRLSAALHFQCATSFRPCALPQAHSTGNRALRENGGTCNWARATEKISPRGLRQL